MITVLFSIFSIFACVACKDGSKVYLMSIIDGISQDALRKYLPNADYIIKELFEDGMMYTDARVDQFLTQTAVSHPSIYTGSPPSVHSIVAEEWIDRLTGEEVFGYNMEGILSTSGSEMPELPNSPGKMIGSTYMDEFIRKNPDSEVFLSGSKDRSGFMGGHHGIKPYAFHWGCALPEIAGEYYSTTYFMDELDQFAIDFNADKTTKFVGPIVWNLEYDIEKYVNKDTDKGSKFGSPLVPDQKTTFPIVIDVDGAGPRVCSRGDGVDYMIFMNSAFGIEVEVDFVKAGIVEKNIGLRGVDDFLQINWSEFDYIGHYDGPNSLTHEDIFYKIDKGLKEIVDLLITRGVKRKDIVIVITGDHGMADTLEDKQDNGFSYADSTQNLLGEGCLGYTDKDAFDVCVNENSLIYKINEAVKAKVGIDYNVITEIRTNYYGYVDWMVKHPGFGKSFITFVPEVQTEDFLYTVESIVADMITRSPMFSTAVTRTDIIRGYVNDKDLTVGFHPENSGNVLFGVDQDIYHWPKYVRNYGLDSTHGTEWGYDNNIPLLFWGDEIPSGVCDRTVYHSAIAPTLARIGGWGKTTGGKGETLKEVVSNIPFIN